MSNSNKEAIFEQIRIRIRGRITNNFELFQNEFEYCPSLEPTPCQKKWQRMHSGSARSFGKPLDKKIE
jgi:hypothetical protein